LRPNLNRRTICLTGMPLNYVQGHFPFRVISVCLDKTASAADSERFRLKEMLERGLLR
jgi:hypothetical protein